MLIKPFTFQRKLQFTLFFALLLLTSLGCKKGSQEQQIIYSNDFEKGNLENISGGIFTTFNNTTVLGRYNNSGFQLKLSALPAHDLVEVSFDLYIYDSWDGNDDTPDGPDIWKLELDGTSFINTTFSNKECPYTCFPQSYPFNYLNSNQQPKNGALITQLPGFCSWLNKPGGSSMYRIVKRIKHNDSNLFIHCLDELKQSNADDRLCDESWSVDNLSVKTIQID